MDPDENPLDPHSSAAHLPKKLIKPLRLGAFARDFSFDLYLKPLGGTPRQRSGAGRSSYLPHSKLRIPHSQVRLRQLDFGVKNRKVALGGREVRLGGRDGCIQFRHFLGQSRQNPVEDQGFGVENDDFRVEKPDLPVGDRVPPVEIRDSRRGFSAR
jgi:hypothetical protein